MKQLLRFAVVLMAAFSLCSCASISLVSTWKESSIPAQKYKKLLIVGVTEKPGMRQIFEEVLVTELLKRGINGVPSYMVTGVKENLSRESLAQAVKKSGADAVVTTRLARIKKDKEVHTGYILTDRGVTNAALFGPELYPNNLFDYYGSTVSYASFGHQSVEVTLSTKVTIETSLFDAGSGRTVWMATTRALDPEGIITISRELSAVVFAAMAREGLI